MKRKSWLLLLAFVVYSPALYAYDLNYSLVKSDKTMKEVTAPIIEQIVSFKDCHFKVKADGVESEIFFKAPDMIKIGNGGKFQLIRGDAVYALDLKRRAAKRLEKEKSAQDFLKPICAAMWKDDISPEYFEQAQSVAVHKVFEAPDFLKALYGKPKPKNLYLITITEKDGARGKTGLPVAKNEYFVDDNMHLIVAKAQYFVGLTGVTERGTLFFMTKAQKVKDIYFPLEGENDFLQVYTGGPRSSQWHFEEIAVNRGINNSEFDISLYTQEPEQIEKKQDKQ